MVVQAVQFVIICYGVPEKLGHMVCIRFYQNILYLYYILELYSNKAAFLRALGLVCHKQKFIYTHGRKHWKRLRRAFYNHQSYNSHRRRHRNIYAPSNMILLVIARLQQIEREYLDRNNWYSPCQIKVTDGQDLKISLICYI